MKKFKYIEVCGDEQYLYDNLNEEGLTVIDNILEAYWNGKIDIIAPHFEDDEEQEVDFCGDFKVIINDKSYVETGFEELIMRWINDWEDTGYMVEYMKDEKFKK